MSTDIGTVSLFFAGMVVAVQCADAAATRSQEVPIHLRAIQVLSQKCQDVGKSTSLHVEGLEKGPTFEMGNYEVKTFFFPADDKSFNFVGILEKGKETDETAHITRICMNKEDHPAANSKEGNIDIPLAAIAMRNATIRFHLNVDKLDADHLERHKWNSPAAMNVAISEHTVGDAVPTKPTTPGLVPKCVKGLTLSGPHREELSFSFFECLPPPGLDWNYSYQLFPLHRRNDGTWTPKGLDPQIIIHAH